MRVFYLTTEFLFPPASGGRVRSLAQLRLLASLPEVSAVVVQGLYEDPPAPADLAAQEALCRELPKLRFLPPVRHPIHIRQRPAWLLRVAATRVARGLPYLAGKWQSVAIAAALRRSITGGRFDVIYIDHLGMAVHLPELRALCPWARVVLEEHNVESDFFRQFAARQTGARRLVAEAEWQAAWRFEADTLRAVDAVVAISADDAAALRALSGAAVAPVVVPQVASFQPRADAKDTAEDAPRLCYLGNLTWHPNVEGLDWLCARVWPEVRRMLPAATLTIAGSGLPTGADGKPRVPPAWQVDGVTCVGFVADPQTLYRDAIGMVAPILGGSGVRIKVLDGLRAGLPTVTTTLGAAGLPLRDGSEALITPSDPAAFAAAVVKLCRDPALRRRLRDGGYAYLRAHHSQEVAAAAMRRALFGAGPSG